MHSFSEKNLRQQQQVCEAKLWSWLSQIFYLCASLLKAHSNLHMQPFVLSPSSPNTKVVRKEQANKNLVAAQSLFWDHLYIAYFHVKSVHLTHKELILPLWPQKIKNYLHFTYWVISLASGTSAASMTSTASMASMTSTASFHQKTWGTWCFHQP